MHVLCCVFRYLNDYFMNHKIATAKSLIWKIANLQFINIFQSLSVSQYLQEMNYTLFLERIKYLFECVILIHYT